MLSLFGVGASIPSKLERWKRPAVFKDWEKSFLIMRHKEIFFNCSEGQEVNIISN